MAAAPRPREDPRRASIDAGLLQQQAQPARRSTPATTPGRASDGGGDSRRRLVEDLAVAGAFEEVDARDIG